MPPRTAERDQAARFAAVDKLRGTGFYPIGGWLFMKDGVAYDLSAADLDQIERIERERLFVVEITDLPAQADQRRCSRVGITPALTGPGEKIMNSKQTGKPGSASSGVHLKCEQQNVPFEVNPLMEYGMRYHRECEGYDQRVCSRKNHRGFGIPEGKEHSLVNRNAKLVRRRLADELIAEGLATSENAIEKMRDAIGMAGEPFRKEWDRQRSA